MRKIKIVIFLVWVFIWVLYDARPLVKQGYLKQYIDLMGKPQEARRAIVYGKGLLEFLNYAKAKMPEGSTYKLIGLEYGSVDIVRAYYHLYPDTRSEKPQFVLVYKTVGFSEAGYSRFSSMNDGNFILKAD